MEAFCNFCGQKLVDDKCPNNHEFKKMCLNCAYLNSEHYCTNNDVMELVRNNILKEIEDKNISLGNFNIANIDLTPTPVKSPTKRCSKWELNNEIINSIIANFK